MSGDYFDFPYWRLDEIASDIEEYIYGHEMDEEEMSNLTYEYQKGWIKKEEYDELKKTRHTEPNRYGYSEETLAKMKEAVKAAKMAYTYIKRVDYLLDSDDSEESFLTRLKEDLDKLDK